jgi:hypothetical protein
MDPLFYLGKFLLQVFPPQWMDFAKCPTADSLTNVHNVEKNIQCSSASQANIREITTQINQTKNNCVQPVTPFRTIEECIISGDKGA